MSWNKFVTTLEIKPSPSRILAVLLVGIHLSALLVLPWLSLPLWILAVIAGLIGLSLLHSSRIHIFHKGMRAVVKLVWYPSGRITVNNDYGDEIEATLDKNQFVQPWLIILNLRLSEGGRRTLILFSDALKADKLHQLRVRLLTKPSAELSEK